MPVYQDLMFSCNLIYAIRKFRHLSCISSCDSAFPPCFPLSKCPSVCLALMLMLSFPDGASDLGLHLQNQYILSTFSCPHTRGL